MIENKFRTISDCYDVIQLCNFIVHTFLVHFLPSKKQGCVLLILGSKGQGQRIVDDWKLVYDHNLLRNPPMIRKLHTLAHHESRIILDVPYINFEVKIVKDFWFFDACYACSTLLPKGALLFYKHLLSYLLLMELNSISSSVQKWGKCCICNTIFSHIHLLNVFCIRMLFKKHASDIMCCVGDTPIRWRKRITPLEVGTWAPVVQSLSGIQRSLFYPILQFLQCVNHIPGLRPCCFHSYVKTAALYIVLVFS